MAIPLGFVLRRPYLVVAFSGLRPGATLLNGSCSEPAVQLPVSLVDRVEDADGALVLKVAMSWEQLQPPVEMTEFGLPKKPFYTSGELGKVLGLSPWQLNDGIAKGLLPQAKHRNNGNRAWTLEEVELILRRKTNHARSRRPVER